MSSLKLLLEVSAFKVIGREDVPTVPVLCAAIHEHFNFSNEKLVKRSMLLIISAKRLGHYREKRCRLKFRVQV